MITTYVPQSAALRSEQIIYKVRTDRTQHDWTIASP